MTVAATKRLWKITLALAFAFACGGFLTAEAQEAVIAPPPGGDGDYEVLTHGPVHEAFATPTTFDPTEQPIIRKQPPEPIEEVLPDHKPAGQNVIWIPGYWAFDDREDDFFWISGLWRNVPPARQWVPGYWHEVDGGYRWAPGTWVRGDASVSFYPEPPASLERGASSRRPSANHFYVPGCWVYRNNDYKWRPGFWAPHQRNWVWVPARYTPTANGYLYSDGYWDYRLGQRGQLFAPVRFRNNAYAAADFRFGPRAVIDSAAQLMLHLFVRPNRGDYVFGDYYDGGATPWFEYQRRDRGYDPLFVYYNWYNGPDFANRIQGWHKYFDGHPEYRPRRTLSDQLAFATEQAEFKYLQQAVMGNTLDQLVATTSNADRFVKLGTNEIERLSGITNQVRGLTGQRLKLESDVGASANAAVNQALRLPTQSLQLPSLPGIRVPQVGRDVPDTPLNLRNVAPQVLQPRNLPTPRLPTRGLPIDIPGLPF